MSDADLPDETLASTRTSFPNPAFRSAADVPSPACAAGAGPGTVELAMPATARKLGRVPDQLGDRPRLTVVTRGESEAGLDLDWSKASFHAVSEAAAVAALTDGIDLDHLDAELAREMQIAASLIQRSLEPVTVRNYAYRWKRWVAYATKRNIPVMPPQVPYVIAFLAGIAQPIAGEAPSVSWVEGHLTAINKACALVGVARPGDDPRMKVFMKGLARVLGRAARNKKKPVVVELLVRMLDELAAERATIREDRLVDAVLAHVATLPLSAAAATRQSWEDVVIGVGQVTVAGHVLADAGGAGGPVAAFTAARDRCGGTGSVLAAAGGAALTPQGLPKRVRRLLAEVGAAAASGRGMPRLDAETAAVIAVRCLAPAPAPLRDTSLILHGWFHARRRSNLSQLVWADMQLVPGRGVRVLYRRSKTDPEARGKVKWLPFHEDPTRCPVRAWLAWREWVAATIGGDPKELTPDAPVYCEVDRWGNQRGPLTGESISHVVKRLVAACGEDPAGYAAYSLRSGWLTSAAERETPIHKMQRNSDHESVDVLLGYIREAEAWADNPAEQAGL
jgi:hypothetical protein